MSQTNVIVASLLFAFVIYITARGQLPQYLGVFFAPSVASAPAPTSDSHAAAVAKDWSKATPGVGEVVNGITGGGGL